MALFLSASCEVISFICMIFSQGEELRAKISMRWSGRAVAVLPVVSLSLSVLPCHLGEFGFFSPPVSIRAVNAPSFFMFLWVCKVWDRNYMY